MTGTIKALQIIRDNEIYKATRFAELMWPESPCWQKIYNIGRGATRGVGLWLAAGSFLRKLQYQGLITIYYPRYGMEVSLTSKGRDLLKRSEAER